MNANVNGINLYYEAHGEGDPLLMIPGWGADITYWQGIIEPLSKSFKLIIFDNRGTGRSDVPAGDYTIRMMADDAAGLLDHIGIPRSHVLGWSMGGAIAQELALGYPEKIDRLVLSATAARFAEKTYFIALSLIEAIERQELKTEINWELSFCFSEEFFADRAAVAELREGALSPAYPVTVEALKSQLAALALHDTRGRLGSIKSPTLALAAEEDGMVRVETVRSLAREIERAEFRVLPGAHMYHVEKPAEFTQAVIEFLQR